MQLIGYCDVDCAGNIDVRLSTSGYCFMLDDNIITRASKKQPTISLSSAEEEYVGACQATKELVCVRRLLEDVGVSQDQPTMLKCDSMSCIALTKNPRLHAKTKHIEIQYHFVREKVVKSKAAIL